MIVAQNILPNCCVDAQDQPVVRIPKQYEGRGGQNAPAWALAICQKEIKCKFTVVLIWKISRSRYRQGYVSGSAWHMCPVHRFGERQWLKRAIKIHQGIFAPLDQQMHVLLHEIAHINVGIAEGHNTVFLQEALRLYKKYDGMVEYAATKAHYANERKICENELKEQRNNIQIEVQ